MPVVNSDSDTVGNPKVVHGNVTNSPTQDDIEAEYLMPEKSGNNVDISLPTNEALPEKVLKPVKQVNLLKPEKVVNCQMTNQTELNNLRTISRAGKAIDSNEYFMNVTQEDNRLFCLDFENAITFWTPVPEAVSTDSAETLILSISDSCFEQAKHEELFDWLKNKVYTVVSDMG